jgi:hypothetical protein
MQSMTPWYLNEGSMLSCTSCDQNGCSIWRINLRLFPVAIGRVNLQVISVSVPSGESGIRISQICYLSSSQGHRLQ